MAEYGGDIFDLSTDTKVHILPQTLNATWDEGVWRALNDQHGLRVERFEAETISPDILPDVISGLRQYLSSGNSDPIVRANLAEMIAFCEDAMARRSAVDLGFS